MDKTICRTARQTAGRLSKMTQQTVTQEHVRVLQKADNPAADVARLILLVEGDGVGGGDGLSAPNRDVRENAAAD